MKMLEMLRAREQELLTQRAQHITRMETIPEAAQAEERAITDPEQTEFDEARDAVEKIDADLAEVRENADRLEKIEARKETSARRSPVVASNPQDVGDPLRLSNRDARAAAVTLVTEARGFAHDDHKASVVNLIERSGRHGAAIARMVLTTGTDLYGEAWLKYASGNHMALSEQERQALSRGWDSYEERTMTSGTGSSGGFFVPVLVDPTLIITGTGAINPMRDISTVKQIGPAFGGWYGATAAQVTAAWTAENNAAPDNTPTVTQPNIPVYMAEAFVGVSFQAYEDIADLATDVQMLFADAKNNLEAAAHQTGSGSSQPTGVVTAVGAVTASRVSPATGGAIALADVSSVHSALPPRFRGNPVSLGWMANVAIEDKIRTLAMAQNSANSVWTDIAGGVPATLWGDSIREGSSMSSSQTTGQDVLLYGDFSRYFIIDRVGFSLEFIPNLFDTSTGRPTASRGWLAHWRTGGNTVDANAFRLLRL